MGGVNETFFTTFGGGGIHHSLLPWGPRSSPGFSCMKSECSACARGKGGIGGGGVVLGVSNDWCIIINFVS